MFNFDENKSASVSAIVFDRIRCNTEASAKRRLTEDRKWFSPDFALVSKWRGVAYKPFPHNFICGVCDETMSA